MKKRTNKLTLDTFKGATCLVEIDFDSDKPVALIFGENGTGKSTLIDAFDFICNGKLGSLEDRSVGGRKYSHLPSFGGQLANLEVQLTYGGQTWIGKIGSGGKPQVNGPQGCPKAKILRRSKILKIVNSQPNERYGELKDYIELPNVDKSEKNLRKTIECLQNEFDEAGRAVEQAQKSLEDYWRKEGSPGKTSESWAKIRVAIDPTGLRNIIKNITPIVDGLNSCLTAEKSLNEAVKDYGTALGIQKVKKDDLTKAQQKLLSASVELIKVLQDSEEYFKKNQAVKACPVCEQGIEVKKLSLRVKSRLHDMSELVQSEREYEESGETLKEKKAVVVSREDEMIGQIDQVIPLIRESDLEEIVILNIEWNNFSALTTEGSRNREVFFKQGQELLLKVSTLKQALEDKKKGDETTLANYNAIKTHLETINEKTKNAKILEQTIGPLKKILDLIETERKSYVEGVLNAISREIDQLYQRIHPNEGIGGVRLSLKEKVSGSLDLTGQFQGQEVSPTAYYSESHLDTLGICVFLALAKYYDDEDSIIILDDVVTSVDQIHLERLMLMLHDEAVNFNQLIIATHYRPWLNRYKYARGPVANIQIIELLHWSISRGIRHTKTKLSIEELEVFLNGASFDRQVVSSKSGILLEALLDHLTLLYECKLPRKPLPNYTLGDLLNSIDSKLKKALTIDRKKEGTADQRIDLSNLLDRINQLSWIRNEVGCHFNICETIADKEVKDFGQLTIDFGKALICQGCGELPRKNSGNDWRCQCGGTHLNPLVHPNCGKPKLVTEVV